MNNTVNIKGSIVIRYVFPYLYEMGLYEKKIDLFIKAITEAGYDHIDLNDFMVKKTKVQDGTIIIEFQYPSLLAQEINLI